jgi:hypothetical protein
VKNGKKDTTSSAPSAGFAQTPADGRPRMAFPNRVRCTFQPPTKEFYSAILRSQHKSLRLFAVLVAVAKAKGKNGTGATGKTRMGAGK